MIRLILSFTLGALTIGLWNILSKPTMQMTRVSSELQTEIEYGKELFIHTARYLGSKGLVAHQMNTRMNCQNCHLDGGRKPYGISLIHTHGRYPDYRGRSGEVVTLAERINNCIERPMNGKPLPENSREMKALLSYFYYLSRGTRIGERAQETELIQMIQFPNRQASIEKGTHLFQSKCIQCHGRNGEGQLNKVQTEFVYPPLWGAESYNEASNMHRTTKLASFIKANMPLGATWDKPLLTDEEAIDLAAFINDPSHSRPRSKWNDYLNISLKPIDYPFGPYADPFSEQTHRLGPFSDIVELLKKEKRTAYY